jgi:hypothetical protein
VSNEPPRGVVTVHPIIAAQIVTEMSQRREARARLARSTSGRSIFTALRVRAAARRAVPPRSAAGRVPVAGR